ncbi:MAG TPA: feruloyl-CoA synthase [Polyangiaceae bacterium]
MNAAPFREASFGPVDVEHIARPDGSTLLRSRVPLGAYPRVVTERLVHWAEQTPDRVFLARRDAQGRWGGVTYRQAFERVQRIAQGLLDRRLGAERPVAVLSENGIEHGLLALAALHVGVPFAPISPSYSLLSADFGRLAHVMRRLTPGLVLVSDGPSYQRAVEHTVPEDVEVIVIGRPLSDRTSAPFGALESADASPDVERAHASIDPDDVAKILFTSGSTGSPKGVINTHRMLASNLQQIGKCFPCMVEAPLELVDWLPWHHTFGGNHNFGLVLHTGGTLHIDDGRPTPSGMAATVENLREIAPTVYFNVPKGFGELLPRLQADAALRTRFFSRLKLMFYAGAGLSQPVWDGLERLALETVGERVVMTSGLGCTESSPSALFAHWPGTWSGLLGVPVPGLELKLARVGQKLEARYRGPNITPGYFRQPEATAAAFDDEGFYRTGDALRFVDEREPARGMLFDGRIAEDFKLSTGTWVNVGPLRATVIEACAPLVADAVLTGLDRDGVGAILFPALPECRRLADLPEDAPSAAIVAHPAVRTSITAALEACAARATGSASRVMRAVLTAAPPSADAGELTDKGSLNQRAVLDCRAALVDSLHAMPPGEGVLVIGKEH